MSLKKALISIDQRFACSLRPWGPMTAPLSSHPLMSALALASHASVAAMIDASVPAIVLGGDGRALRFMNAAASQVLGVRSARSLLNGPAPLDEAIGRHLQRVAANGSAGRRSTERIRFYRGIRPIVLTVVVEHLGMIGGVSALLVTLPEMARANMDGGLQATLDLCMPAPTNSSPPSAATMSWPSRGVMPCSTMRRARSRLWPSERRTNSWRRRGSRPRMACVRCCSSVRPGRCVLRQPPDVYRPVLEPICR